jgi:hypothetical protein
MPLLSVCGTNWHCAQRKETDLSTSPDITKTALQTSDIQNLHGWPQMCEIAFGVSTAAIMSPSNQNKTIPLQTGKV